MMEHAMEHLAVKEGLFPLLADDGKVLHAPGCRLGP